MLSPNVVLNNFLGTVQQSYRSSALVRWVLQALALSQAFKSTGWPDNHNLHDGDKFDFIVVGSGSAGAVVAARLSEMPHWRVLLIEAGGDPPPASVIPSLFATLAHTQYDWDYKGLLDEDVGNSHPNRSLFMARGKVLGGSSSINYEFYSRGVPQDYEDWDKVAPGWNWNTAFHYFMKLENMTDSTILNNPKNSQWHSTKGPMKISRPSDNTYFSKISDHVLNSYQEMGIKRTLENNGPEPFGASTPHFTFSDGIRSSTAEAYLKPNRDRPNLFIAKHTRAIQILIDKNRRAYGVKIIHLGNVINLYFNFEVIVSAGSIETPKLLMLSGIGPKEELHKHNIDMVVDLPVGRNLHDHQIVPIVFSGQFGLKTAKQNLMVFDELNSYPVPMQNGFFSLNSSSNKPQFQITNLRAGAGASAVLFFGCSSITNYDSDFCKSLAKANTLHEIDFSLLVLLHPLSRGKISLRNKNPLEDPIIEMGYYRHRDDVDLMANGIKFMVSLVNTTYYRKIKSDVVKLDVNKCNELTWGTDRYWECYARNSVGSLLHPVGTCAMGPNGVVDETLKVYQVLNMRIVDASIMPKITSGNTNVPTVMIGEKAADMIKFDYLDYNTIV